MKTYIRRAFPWLDVLLTKRAHARETARREALLVDARKAVADFPREMRTTPSGLPTDLVISLTSHPPRFPTLAFTLRSLLNQEIRAERLLLWLTEEHYRELPKDVLELQEHGLEIRICRDMRSYAKLVPTLAAFPEAYVVTADDDVYYPNNWLSSLVSTAASNPGAIAGTRAHLAKFTEDGRAIPYRDWDLETLVCSSDAPGEALFLTGVGGIIYPPNWYPPEMLDVSLFMELCPMADDVWFFAMQDLRPTARVRVPGYFDIVTWPSSQDTGLMHTNLAEDGNDLQIEAVQDRFPTLRERHSRAAKLRP